MEWFFPTALSDLSDAFERLEHGVSVALATKGPEQNLAANGTGFETCPPSEVCLGCWSSASTGHPKLVWKSWSALKRNPVKDERLHGWTWASPFHPISFAGVQVALQAWRTSGQALSLTNHWDQNWKLLTTRAVEAICCTPTFLDLLLQWEVSSTQSWHPRQITLGGEVLRPALAARIEQQFQRARFTLIYASAEFGVLAKTNRMDGWYEVKALDDYCGTWRLRDGILELFRGGEWFSSADRLELQGERFRVLGRADGVANVGGVKVSLAEITSAAEEVAGVRRAVAFFEPNAIVGQIVSLKFALDNTSEPQEVEGRLQVHLRKHLRKEAWPRRWILDEVGLGWNAKGITH